MAAATYWSVGSVTELADIRKHAQWCAEREMPYGNSHHVLELLDRVRLAENKAQLAGEAIEKRQLVEYQYTVLRQNLAREHLESVARERDLLLRISVLEAKLRETQ